jgi:hypothetical protein
VDSLQKFALNFLFPFSLSTCDDQNIDIDTKDKTFNFKPVNSNGCQRFEISDDVELDQITLKFPDSTDLFGRITIYKLEFLG